MKTLCAVFAFIIIILVATLLVALSHFMYFIIIFIIIHMMNSRHFWYANQPRMQHPASVHRTHTHARTADTDSVHEILGFNIRHNVLFYFLFSFDSINNISHSTLHMERSQCKFSSTASHLACSMECPLDIHRARGERVGEKPNFGTSFCVNYTLHTNASNRSHRRR